MTDKITKVELAKKLNISRPTLDKYLKEGFPKKMINSCENDNEYEILVIENEIRELEFKLNRLKKRLIELGTNVKDDTDTIIRNKVMDILHKENLRKTYIGAGKGINERN